MTQLCIFYYVRYLFKDFTIVGVPMTLIIGIVALIVIPLVFPF